ncbi:hypothetical protein M378DRAFT_856089 [Amanita muscaria Koide BX008]|uniref:Uncharacterized protein n=1 Tax=Amanita muscaria (strain Koide BX008) TaxID=946122 RepID=A0A0C2WXB9_AMAMK|nr:hypothetical protein M378DRAFT_856089 [Amanita muscaria Koide BX008]
MTLVASTNEIVLSFVTAILFGLHFASFVHCVRWLLFEDEGWRVRKKPNRGLVITTLLVFFLSTVSFSTTVYTTVALERHPTSLTMLLKFTPIYLPIPVIIDGVLIHRCWIVFSKNWFIICFPLALWCSSLICAIISLYCHISPAFINGLSPAIINESSPTFTVKTCGSGPYVGVALFAFLSCNIVINIYTTSALVFKIWRAAENNGGTNRLYRTSRILTESGILYTSSSVFFLACWIAYYIVVLCFQPAFTVDSFFLSDLLIKIAKSVVSTRY